LQVGDTGPVESARRSNSRVLGSPFSGLSGQLVPYLQGGSTSYNSLIKYGNYQCSGSVTCWYESEYRSGSLDLYGTSRFLLFSSVTFKVPTKKKFPTFFAYYFLKVHLHHSSLIKKVLRKEVIKL
jgi:hypothetical protein